MIYSFVICTKCFLKYHKTKTLKVYASYLTEKATKIYKMRSPIKYYNPTWIYFVNIFCKIFDYCFLSTSFSINNILFK